MLLNFVIVIRVFLKLLQQIRQAQTRSKKKSSFKYFKDEKINTPYTIIYTVPIYTYCPILYS